MAKKVRSKGGVLSIGKVYPHRRGWRVQLKIVDKVQYGPLRSSEGGANADLENLRKSGGRKEMQRLLAKLRHRIQQAKKEKSEEQKARQKLQKVQQKKRQKQEKNKPERLKRGPSIEEVKDPWLRELKIGLAKNRKMHKQAGQEEKVKTACVQSLPSTTEPRVLSSSNY